MDEKVKEKKYNTPWVKIKAEYLQGAFPKELAKKYNITAKQISDKANKEKWVNEKSKICEKVRENVESQVGRITNLALERLESVLKCKEIRNNDLIAAIGKALEISGLKSSKQEITGKDGAPLTEKVIYVTPEEQNEVKEHIRQTING